MQTHQEKLILDSEEKPDEVPNFKQTARTIISLCMWPIIGSLFHPIYTVVNAAVCGRLGDHALAAFGLGSLTCGIMALSIGVCFSISCGTLIAQAHGANEPRMCRVYLYRQYYLNSLMFPFILIPLIFIRQVYSAIG
jgi:Na+-driven multidrug efflux pump